MLHFRHATPHYGVIALAIVSAVLGGYAVLSADNLLQITLASNTGTFLVYGMTNALVLVAFGGEHKRSVVKHVIVPVAGLIANIAMLVGVVVMSVSSGGSTQTDTLIALGDRGRLDRRRRRLAGLQLGRHQDQPAGQTADRKSRAVASHSPSIETAPVAYARRGLTISTQR